MTIWTCLAVLSVELARCVSAYKVLRKDGDADLLSSINSAEDVDSVSRSHPIIVGEAVRQPSLNCQE